MIRSCSVSRNFAASQIIGFDIENSDSNKVILAQSTTQYHTRNALVSYGSARFSSLHFILSLVSCERACSIDFISAADVR